MEEVKVGQGTHNLCGIKPCGGEGESSVAVEIGEEFTTADVGGKKVKKLIFFKAPRDIRKG